MASQRRPPSPSPSGPANRETAPDDSARQLDGPAHGASTGAISNIVGKNVASTASASASGDIDATGLPGPEAAQRPTTSSTHHSRFDMAHIPNHSQAPHPAGSLLEIDSDGTDSAIGDVSASTLTQSVRSSVYEFVEENGRTYHKFRAGSEGQYFLPNDEREQDRLDLQHQLFLLTFDNQMHLSPTGPLHNVLDIGTGTGIWAIDFALRNPAAAVLGTDLSPIQPENIPPNCSFEIEDAEDPWVFPQKFDLIHGRALASCFKSPAGVIRSAAAALAPGGWLEFQDLVLPMRCIDDGWAGSALQRWNDLLVECAARVGRDVACAERYAAMFAAAGLEGVGERHFVWASNQWAKGARNKRLAMWFRKDVSDGLEAVSLRLLTGVAGMRRDEVSAMLAEVKRDLGNPRYHAYMPVVVTMGRKPLGA